MKHLRQYIRNILLNEAKFNDYSAFTPEERRDLKLMEHDKDHVDIENNAGLAKAFKLYSETTTVPLYRGIYDVERTLLSGKNPGDVFQFGRITSMSENYAVAKKFAKRNQTNTIIELTPGAPGCFSLVGFLVHRYETWEEMDKYDYQMQDGDWRKESAEREAEWFLQGGANFQLLEITQQGEITIYKIKSV